MMFMIMSSFEAYCAFAPEWWVVFKKASATPLFLEDENIFQKSKLGMLWMHRRKCVYANTAERLGVGDMQHMPYGTGS